MSKSNLHNTRENEYVVVGISQSTILSNSNRDNLSIASSYQLGAYNDPIKFYEYFLSAISR